MLITILIRGTAMQWHDRIGRRLKLRDLHIMLAVVQRRSMAKAASDLAISQPAVSKAISDMEHVLGLRLLDRTPQGIEPTVYGEAVLKHARALFDQSRRYRSLSFWPIRQRA